jgi:hypothetical protein
VHIWKIFIAQADRPNQAALHRRLRRSSSSSDLFFSKVSVLRALYLLFGGLRSQMACLSSKARSRIVQKVSLPILLALSCAHAAVVLGQTTQDRASVFLLVDESGTMKRDQQGWRKEAGALLLYSMPDGSTFAATGFGNPDRKLSLDPLLLDPSETGRKNRDGLLRTIQSLGDSDAQTDIFGAIASTLAKISTFDPDTRSSRPQYIVMLSDFEPDPNPGEQVRSSVCEQLKHQNVHFIAVGFGRVHRPTLDYLRSCGDVSEWGPVLDSAALIEVFWEIQHRIWRSLPVAHHDLRAGESVKVTFPAWAGEAFVLASAARQSGQRPSCRDITGATYSEGKSFRLLRINPKQQSAIDLSCAIGVQVSAVASGAIQLQTTFDPRSPWLINEPIKATGTLVSAADGRIIKDWVPIASTQASGVWMLGDSLIPLVLNPESGSVVGDAIAPDRNVSVKGLVQMSVGAARWGHAYEAKIISAPVRLTHYSVRTVLDSEMLSLALESALEGREFALTFRDPEGFTVVPRTVKFSDSQAIQTIHLIKRGSSPNMLVRGVEGLLESLTRVSRSSTLRISAEFSTGGLASRPLISPIEVEIQPYSRPVLWATVVVALGLPIAFVLVLIAGPRFPRGFLTPCDLSGRPVKSGVLIELERYRKKLNLEPWGLAGSKLLAKWSGRIIVELGPETSLRESSQGYRRSAATRACELSPDDILVRESGTTVTGFKFDRR